MRKIVKFIYVAMATFVMVVLIAAIVALGLASAQTTEGKLGWLAFGAFFGVSAINFVYVEWFGRPLIAWWPTSPMWIKSLWLKFIFILPLFGFICYLLLYAALVNINGTRPEWLEP